MHVQDNEAILTSLRRAESTSRALEQGVHDLVNVSTSTKLEINRLRLLVETMIENAPASLEIVSQPPPSPTEPIPPPVQFCLLCSEWEYFWDVIEVDLADIRTDMDLFSAISVKLAGHRSVMLRSFRSRFGWLNWYGLLRVDFVTVSLCPRPCLSLGLLTSASFVPGKLEHTIYAHLKTGRKEMPTQLFFWPRCGTPGAKGHRLNASMS